jgi:hypothetical protein
VVQDKCALKLFANRLKGGWSSDILKTSVKHRKRSRNSDKWQNNRSSCNLPGGSREALIRNSHSWVLRL